MGSVRLGKQRLLRAGGLSGGHQRELFLITVAMVPAIGEFNLGTTSE